MWKKKEKVEKKKGMERFCAEGREEEEGDVKEKKIKRRRRRRKEEEKEKQKTKRAVQEMHRHLRTHSLA